MRKKPDPNVGIRAREFVEAYVQQKQVSIAYACKKIGVDRKRVYDWANGKPPSIDQLWHLGKAGADLDYILLGRRSNAEQDH